MGHFIQYVDQWSEIRSGHSSHGYAPLPIGDMDRDRFILFLTIINSSAAKPGAI